MYMLHEILPQIQEFFVKANNDGEFDLRISEISSRFSRPTDSVGFLINDLLAGRLSEDELNEEIEILNNIFDNYHLVLNPEISEILDPPAPNATDHEVVEFFGVGADVHLVGAECYKTEG